MPKVKEIKELIIQNDLDKALNILYEVITSNYSQLETPCIILISDYNSHREKETKGLVDYDKLNLWNNQIRDRLLNLLSDIEKENKNLTNTKEETIFFLGSTPVIDQDLREEVIDIDKHLKKYEARHNYHFEMRMHVKANELTDLLYDLKHDPKFLHFSGHAVYKPLHPEYGTGILFEDQKYEYFLMNGDDMGRILSSWGNLECVVLNACHSAPSALSISRHLPYAIGYKSYITNKSAIAFAVGFYKAIGNNKSIEEAFELGRFEITTNGFVKNEANNILLFKKDNKYSEKDLWDGKNKDEWRTELMANYYLENR